MGRIGLGLLAETAKSSRTARERLFKQIYPLLSHYIRARVSGKTEREDVLQEVCLKVATKLSAYSMAKGSFQGWMYTIARNVVIDSYRSNGRRDDEPLAQDILDETANPLDLALDDETKRAVRESVAGLSPQQKEIVEMRYFFEMRNREIAERLGIEERSVSSALTRGLKKLQKVFDGEERQ